jgi:FkbM family methyltransferase
MDLQVAVKRIFRALGFDVVRLKNVPSYSFLGLSGRRFDSILDVGANDGGFAKSIVGMFPGVALHCFEPLPGPAQALRRWAVDRGFAQITVHEVGLSDHEGQAELIEHVNHSTSSSLLQATPEARALFPFTARTETRRIELTTLDAWAARQPRALGRSLLKLDVQGLEDRVLRGARLTMSSVDACIVEVSIARLYEGQAEFVTLVNALKDCGLAYYGNLEQHYDALGAPIFVDCAFVRPAV